MKKIYFIDIELLIAFYHIVFIIKGLSCARYYLGTVEEHKTYLLPALQELTLQLGANLMRMVEQS